MAKKEWYKSPKVWPISFNSMTWIQTSRAAKLSFPPYSLDGYNDETRRKQPSGRLLFMEGYPSPQWLNHLGSKFDIDPEFYFRHLEFDHIQKTPTHFFMSSLPSVAEIIRIRITSILSRNDFQFEPEHTIADLRKTSEVHMDEYLNNLVKSLKVSLSESIVRRFSVHDKQHFSIEQMVTICVTHKSPGWTGARPHLPKLRMFWLPKLPALIWLDHGKDLSRSSTGPWKALQQHSRNPWSLSVLPTIQYLSRIALKREPNIPANPDHFSTQQRAPRLPQNSAHLASDYGRSLRPEVMESDVFYALDELFRFAIASESQFLEMMKHKIKAATITGGGGRIEDLDAALDLIEDHRQYINESLEVVRVGGHPNWPKAPDKLRKKAIAARERLESDYEYLLNYAEGLSKKCIEGITIMMNDAMLRQSQQAIAQAEATMKLTLLAFIFAPLSFTTSFFSMQIREIEGKDLSLWIWCLFTSVLLLISFSFWKWRPLALLSQCWTTINVHLLRLV